LFHLLVTQDFPPDLGGMARRHVELARRFSGMRVSTVANAGAGEADDDEPFEVYRQPFTFAEAKRFVNQLRWAGWLRGECQRGEVAMLHCGNLRPAGYPVWRAARRTGTPYLVYVNGLDLLVERYKAGRSAMKRRVSQGVFGDAAGIVANSAWTGDLAEEVMRDVGVQSPPPVARIDLGTDPACFRPDRDSGTLRARWGVGDAPLMLTVGRLARQKGQDVAIRALARLAGELPALRYVVVGRGSDEARLRELAVAEGVAERVIFTGALTDDEIAEAYATATVYVGLSRMEGEFDVEGFGIAFVEAGASGVPSVAGRSGGVPSAVRHGETGILVTPDDALSAADAIASLLRDPARRAAMGAAARRAVETHYNWDRVAAETEAFAARVRGTPGE
jgi:phosphatidyl-myo-inositol dimannoside synthase